MKYKLLLILVLLVFSCDYWGEYEYKIQNNTDKDIQIRIFAGNWRPNDIQQDSFNIKSTETQLLRVTKSENLGCTSDNPCGCYKIIEDLGDIKVYYDGKLIDKDFKDIIYWSYKSKSKGIGTYLIIIDDSIF